MSIFGEAAGLPFSAERERAALDLGYMRLVPGARDKEGRQVILIKVAALRHKVADAKAMVRSMWYVLHAALEDPDVGRTGRVVCVTSAADFKMSEFNPEFDRLGLQGEKCLPVRARPA